MKKNFFLLKISIKITLELILLPITLICALLSRYKKKKVDIGLGPEPIINNIYHKKALSLYGFTAETFVNGTSFITDEFDINASKYFRSEFFRHMYLFILSLFRYRVLYIYFNGGPLSATHLLCFVEPFVYRLARKNVVVMPYGGDIQDMLQTPNLQFRHAIAKDYPGHRFARKKIQRNIDRWTKWGDHIISGCDWVDYMYYWDTLLLAHFSIDSDRLLVSKANSDLRKNKRIFRILHAPNHRSVKGTQFFIKAVEDLQKEGFEIELVLVEKQANSKVLEAIQSVDLVADQLIIGWYAMFAIESMAMGKPVLCYLRQDLIDLYASAGLVAEEEIPLIRCDIKSVKDKIQFFYQNRQKLEEIGLESKRFVEKYHSLKAIGSVFHSINLKLGLKPQNAKR